MADKGLAKIDDNNRPMLEAAVKAEKKGKLIAEKYKSAASVDAIAQSAAQPLQTDSVKLSNSFGPVIGFEPKAIGYAFFSGLQPNTLSPAIQGRDGVVYISVISRAATPADLTDPNAKAQQKMTMDMQNRNAVSGMIQEAVKRIARVQYNPDRLY
jgi:peptidyl-prolyl cis-trans isomerase D